MDSVETTILRAARRRPLLLCRVLPAEQLDRLRKWVSEVDGNRWVRGDESSHAWQEFLLDRSELDAVLTLAPYLARLTKGGAQLAAWVNSFTQGEWIGEHRDADGDAQLIVPIAMPRPNQGGDLWINDEGCIVPLRLGDVLAFNAASHAHGTTVLMHSKPTRTTLNIRLWLPNV